ncbi:DUF1349 domain-containing protein [Flavobacterium kingsejongi]|uniref:DUF1349 domain-containing protein n=1 Tax=Flavobacterium kingsejongi TaxID=1678728 RepID=A0A2S1LJJ8_9FLAO|nr:DUF1349 domain-containing protein [Flavobacterium kingsejongi]AWG23861.1 hypothetical protein FK004_00795 [Flavobacterium kingsejongi]
MKKIFLILVCTFTIIMEGNAQKLSSMHWLNEPAEWEIKDNKLTMEVTPQSDYWTKSHYEFTVHDGPFLYTERSGEFETVVKMSGVYKTRFDQVCLMLRIDENNYIKTGVEYVDGVYNISTVHTIDKSSWSVMALKEKPKNVWMKAVRRLDAVEIFYSLDGKNFTMTNTVYFPEFKTVQVGMMAASPDGNGFKAIFEEFKIIHLPDKRRLEWLQKNQ